jgi:hypothetical protein
MLQRSSNVYLSVPHGPDRDVLRASLLAIQGVPTNLPAELHARRAALKNLEQDPNSFVFLDISRRALEGQGLVLGGIAEALSSVPLGLRSRTVLTQVPYSFVSAAQRTFVKSLGFCDFLSEFESQDIDGRLRSVLASCSKVVGTPSVSQDDLSRYLSALGTNDKGAPRLTIWRHTGLSVGPLIDLLSKHLEIHDRSYHLKKYSKCFVASEAILWMSRRFKIPISAALAVGKALASLGLIYHVEHEHQFSDNYLFFRLVHSNSSFTVDLGDVYLLLLNKLQIEDRNYLGKTYHNCWVGVEAIDILCENYAIPRYVSYMLMHWLEQLGLFVHVANQQSFADANYFFQFHHQIEILEHIKLREIAS